MNVIWVTSFEREFFFLFVGLLINDQQFRGITVLHDQHAILSQRISGMDLGFWRRVVIPDNLLIASDFAGSEPAREDNVPVGEHGAIAQLFFSRDGVCPYDSSLAYNVHRLLRVATLLPFTA